MNPAHNFKRPLLRCQKNAQFSKMSQKWHNSVKIVTGVNFQNEKLFALYRPSVKLKCIFVILTVAALIGVENTSDGGPVNRGSAAETDRFLGKTAKKHVSGTPQKPNFTAR